MMIEVTLIVKEKLAAEMEGRRGVSSLMDGADTPVTSSP